MVVGIYHWKHPSLLTVSLYAPAASYAWGQYSLSEFMIAVKVLMHSSQVGRQLLRGNDRYRSLGILLDAAEQYQLVESGMSSQATSIHTAHWNFLSWGLLAVDTPPDYSFGRTPVVHPLCLAMLVGAAEGAPPKS